MKIQSLLLLIKQKVSNIAKNKIKKIRKFNKRSQLLAYLLRFSMKNS